MLGDEHRVAAEWGLLPVVPGMCRGEPLVDEVSPVVENGSEAFRRQVAAFLGPEPEASAEWRSRQPCENLVDITHVVAFPRPNPNHKEPYFGSTIDSSS